jgi:hypothetical protein
MKRFMYTMAGVLALLLMIGLVPVLSQDGMGGGDAAGDEKGEAKSEVPKTFEEAAKPGPEHKMLAGMVGTWEVKGTSWQMQEDGTVVVAKFAGTSKVKMIHDRFLLEELSTKYEGAEGKTMSGTFLIGYDRDALEYQSCAVGDWATGMLLFRGQMSDDGKKLEMTTEFNCRVMNNAPMKMRLVSTMKSEDEATFEMYSKMGDMDEMKMEEMHYKRKK